MKKAMKRWRMLVTVFLVAGAASISSTKAQGTVSLQIFYDELQPYGTWMAHGQYGYVWSPHVGRDFTPYATNGYWINTEYGNTWVSDYSWGWAPFHYGRWAFDDMYGWVWVPDTEWAPAWVAWRSGGGYYGWAPLMPGIHMQMAFNYYDRIPHHYWSFVPHRYITYRQVYTHCVPRPNVINIYNQTTIVTHNYTDNRRRTYFTGPSRNEIERVSRSRVEVYKVNDGNRPGRTEVSRGSVNFYRPEINNSHESKSRSIPSTYVRKDRSGYLERIEISKDRTSINPSTKKTNDFRTVERNKTGNGNQTPQRNSYDRNRDVLQNTYHRPQPSTQREFRNTTRENDLPVEQNRQPVIRDQRDFNQQQRAPQVENWNRNRTNNTPREQLPANRTLQRQTSTTQRQTWERVERQNTNRQETSAPVQRQRSFENTTPSRSSLRQSRGTQEVQPNNSNSIRRQPSRGTEGSGQAPTRTRH